MADRFFITAELRMAAPTNANVQSVIRQIENQFRGVNISLNVNVNARQLNNVTTSLNAVRRAADDSTDSMEAFGRQSALAIRRYTAFAVATGTFLSLGRAIQSAFGDAIEFDKQLTKLRQVTGQSQREILGFSDTITKLATGLGISSQKLSEVSLVLAQAGLTARDTTTALKVLAKTELSATFDDITDTTEGAIAIINQFGGGVNSLERDLSALNSVSAKFAVESSDLVVAVRRTGGAFQAAGGSLNELLALFTSVRQTTRESAETIATGFRTIFTRLQRTRTVNFLETLGINLRNLEGEFVGPYEAVRRLSSALKNISSTDPRFAQIIEELGGFRQVSKVIPLIKQFEISEKALSVALRSGNSLSQDAAVAQESLANKITKVKEEFAALIRTLSQNQSIRDFIEIALKLASSLIRVADSLQGVLPLLATLGGIGASRGLVGFTRGFTSELGTTRRFARGGLVPGQGNGDTVPALLTPGEFVMKKSAVKALGVNNLAQMNGVQKFAVGGKVEDFFSSFDITPTTKDNVDERISDYTGRQRKSLTKSDIEKIKNRLNNTNQQTLNLQDLEDKHAKFTTNDTIAGYYLKSDLGKNSNEIKTIDYTKLKDSYSELATKIQNKGLGNLLPSEVLLKNFTINNDSKNRFYDKIDEPIKGTILHASNSLVPKDPAPLDIQAPELNRILKNINIESIYGNIFEGALQAYTKNIRTGGPTAILDFERLQDYKGQFEALFGPGAVDGVSIGDAKLTRNAKSEASLVDKFARERLNSIADANRNLGLEPIYRANGGGVPGQGNSDTVPALLTPGEFVINKKAAQAIGYGNLARANKVKKFATGGRVGATGAALGIGGLSVALPVILGNFVNFGEEFGKVANTITSVVTNFAIFNELLKNVTGVKQFQDSIAEIDDNLSNLSNNVSGFVTTIRQNTTNINRNRREQVQILSRANGRPLSADESARIRALSDENIELRRSTRTNQQSIRDTINQRRGIQNNRRTAAGTLRNRQALNIGAAAGATALTIGSQYFGEKADANFTDGNFGAAKNFALASGTLSGAGSGAGFGAAIGSVIPVLGTFAGAAIGGAIGALAGFTTSLSEADGKISRLQFDKTFEDFSQTLDGINKDKLSAFSKAIDVNKTLLLTRERFAKVSGADKETLTGQIDAQVVNLEGFLTKLAEGSKTFEDFQKVGNIAVGFLAQFTNQTVAEVNTKFKNLIEQQGKTLKLSKEQAEQEARNLQRLKDIGNLTSAFKDLSVEVNRQINAQKGYTDFLLGGKFSSGGSVDESDIFDRIGNLTNPARFNQLATNIGNNAGETGSKLANELIQSSEAIKNLPSILVESTRNTLESDGGFEGNLKRALGDKVPDFLIQGIQANLSKLRGPEGNDEKVIGDILRDPTKVAEQLTENIQLIGDVFKTAAPIIQSQIDAVSEALSTGRELRQKLIEGEGKIDQIRNDTERIITEGLGKTFDPQNNINVRRTDINRQIGLAGRVGLSANSIGEANARIKEIEAKQQLAALDQKRVNELEIQKSQEIQSIEAARNALEKLADASGDLADLQNKLTKAGEKRQLLTGAAETLTFGDPASIRQLTKNVVSATALAGGSTSSAFRNSETLSFLKSVGDTKLGVLGGKSGTDVIKEQAANQLSSLGLTGDEISRVLEVTEDEKAIISQIRDRSNEAVAAQQELNKLISTGITLNQKSIDSMIQGFGDTLGKFLKQAEDERLKRADLDNKRIEARNTSIKENKAVFGNINENQFSANKQQFEEIKQLQQARDSIAKINGKNVGFDFFNKFNTFDQSKVAAQDREAFIQDYIKNFSSKSQSEIRGLFDRNINLGPLGISEIDDIANRDTADYNTRINEISTSLKAAFGDTDFNFILENLAKLKEALKNLENLRDTGITPTVPLVGAAFGGMVPGAGNKDTVPAVLMPGEIVMRKKAVQKYGADTLLAMNNGTAPMMAKGGPAVGTLSYFKKKAKEESDKELLARGPDIGPSFYDEKPLGDKDAGGIMDYSNAKSVLDNAFSPLNPKNSQRIKNASYNATEILRKQTSAQANESRDKLKAAQLRSDTNMDFVEDETRVDGQYVPKFANKIKAAREALINDNKNFENDIARRPLETNEDLANKAKLNETKRKSAENAAKAASSPEGIKKAEIAKKLNRSPEEIRAKIYEDRANKSEGTAFKTAHHKKIQEIIGPEKYASTMDSIGLKTARPTVTEAGNYSQNQRQVDKSSVSLEQGIVADKRSKASKLIQAFGGNPLRERKLSKTEGLPAPISERQGLLNKNKAAYEAEMERRRSSPEARRRGIQPTPSNKPLNFGDVFGSNQASTTKPNQGESVNKFAQNSEALVTSLNNFPREITMNATHRIEVIFNGAEVLAQLQKPLQDMMIAKATQELNRYIKTNTPEAPMITVTA